MYDAIVVGARCAGSPTALLLARKGYKVLLLDRANFPSDTVSTHYIHQPGVASLKRWGLLDRLVATGCPAIGQQVFDVGPFRIEGTPPPSDGVSVGYAPRRTVLDKLLLDAAVEAGAEFREQFSVEEVITEGDRVTGIRGRSKGGELVEEKARIVVGADGKNSVIAKLVGAPAYAEQPAGSCAYYSYWRDVPMLVAELYPRPASMLIAAPTHDGLTLLIVYWPEAEFAKVRDDIEGNFMAALDTVPGLAERFRAGTRAEKFRGAGDLRGFLRRPHGPGWALVGDAGYHKDPITAQGMLDAFRDADLVAAAVDEGLDDDLDRSLAHFEASRDAAVAAMYDFTCQLAHVELPPPPEMQQLIAALVGNQPEIDRFFGVMAGSVSVTDFYAPHNVDRLLAA